MPNPPYQKGPHEVKTDLSYYMEIVLLRAKLSDGGLLLEVGTRGHIVEHLALDECILEFSVPDNLLEGGIRVETCLACRDNWAFVDAPT